MKAGYGPVGNCVVVGGSVRVGKGRCGERCRDVGKCGGRCGKTCCGVREGEGRCREVWG